MPCSERASSTVWLTKAVDITVSYPVHVVVYTVPSLRKPPVLLVLRTLLSSNADYRSNETRKLHAHQRQRKQPGSPGCFNYHSVTSIVI